MTGETIVWFVAGGGIGGWAYAPQVADTAWAITRLADVDGDGAADLVWRNGATGDNTLWLMNGSAIRSTAFLIQLTDQNWELVGR